MSHRLVAGLQAAALVAAPALAARPDFEAVLRQNSIRWASGQVCDGEGRRFGISRDTVRSATLIPTFKSAPWILGAPHRGIAAAIRATKARISGVTGGRPTTGRRESRVH